LRALGKEVSSKDSTEIAYGQSQAAMSTRMANPRERKVINKIAQLYAAENWQGVVAMEEKGRETEAEMRVATLTRELLSQSKKIFQWLQ